MQNYVIDYTPGKQNTEECDCVVLITGTEYGFILELARHMSEQPMASSECVVCWEIRDDTYTWWCNSGNLPSWITRWWPSCQLTLDHVLQALSLMEYHMANNQICAWSDITFGSVESIEHNPVDKSRLSRVNALANENRPFLSMTWPNSRSSQPRHYQLRILMYGCTDKPGDLESHLGWTCTALRSWERCTHTPRAALVRD